MSELWPCADVRCRDREQAYREQIAQLKKQFTDNVVYTGALERTNADLIAERDRLLKEVRKLDALEAMGVDNWEGYSDAMQYMNEQP